MTNSDQAILISAIAPITTSVIPMGIFQYWGIVPYLEAWQAQRSLVSERLANPQLPDIVITVEHPPVYTLGKGASLEHLKFDPQTTEVEIHRVERGGEVTYHCPGQLVVYPILNLQRHQPDLHWYLRQLEEVVIQLLVSYGVKAQRQSGLTGVWVGDVKVAAIGIKVKRWITMHGLALNVCPDLAGFERIVPCGIADKAVGSLEEYIPGVTMEQIIHDFRSVFGEVFDLQWVKP